MAGAGETPPAPFNTKSDPTGFFQEFRSSSDSHLSRVSSSTFALPLTGRQKSVLWIVCGV